MVKFNYPGQVSGSTSGHSNPAPHERCGKTYHPRVVESHQSTTNLMRRWIGRHPHHLMYSIIIIQRTAKLVSSKRHSMRFFILEWSNGPDPSS